MAVSFVEQTFQRKFVEESGGQTGTRMYLRRFTTAITDIDEALQDDSTYPIPLMGESWSVGRSNLTVRKRTPMEMNLEKTIYLIQIDYATPKGATEPDSLRWDISWSKNSIEWVVEKSLVSLVDTGTPASRTIGTNSDLKDSDDDPFFSNVYLWREGTSISTNSAVMNAATDTYDPPIVTQLTIPQVTLSKQYSSLAVSPTVESLTNLIGTCNLTAETIAGKAGVKWQWKVDDVTIQKILDEDGDEAYQVTYVLQWHPHTWLQVIPNAGYNRLDDNDVLTPIIGKDKRVVSSPRALTKAGYVVPQESVRASKTYYAWAANYLTEFSTFSFPATI